MDHDVFISYSSKEKSVAYGVCHYLEEHGIKCWIAPRDIPPSSDYGDLIDKAIESCSVTVLIFSQWASLSKWVKGEINVAFDEGKPIIPFRIDETAITGALRVMLKQKHWIEAYPSYVDRLPDLLRSICSIVDNPITDPVTPVQISPMEDVKVSKPQSMEAELHIEVDSDCRVYRFGKEIMLVRKGEDNVLMLQKGKHKLRFVLVGNNNVTEEHIVEIKDTNYCDFIEINFAERMAKENAERKAKEEAERKAKEEAERQVREEAERKKKEEARRRIIEESERLEREELSYIAKGYTLVGAGKTILTKEDVEALGKNVSKVVISHTVNTIGEKAFYNYTQLTSVIIPNTITHIKEEAFWDCSGLLSVTIPDSVVSIGECAFHGCESLSSVTIPDTVNTIGDSAFCLVKNVIYHGEIPAYKLKANTVNGFVENGIVFEDSTKKVLTGYFGRSSTVVIPSSVEEIDRYAFCGCGWLTKVTIPNTVTEIGSFAFHSTGLTSIILPNSITEINIDTFNNCEKLTSVTIPNSVTRIGAYAFNSCESLTSIIIPDSVIEIEHNAFSFCENLTSITIPKSVRTLGETVFEYCKKLKTVRLLNPNTQYCISADEWKCTFPKHTKIIKG